MVPLCWDAQKSFAGSDVPSPKRRMPRKCSSLPVIKHYQFGPDSWRDPAVEMVVADATKCRFPERLRSKWRRKSGAKQSSDRAGRLAAFFQDGLFGLGSQIPCFSLSSLWLWHSTMPLLFRSLPQDSVPHLWLLVWLTSLDSPSLPETQHGQCRALLISTQILLLPALAPCLFTCVSLRCHADSQPWLHLWFLPLSHSFLTFSPLAISATSSGTMLLKCDLFSLLPRPKSVL